MREQRGPIQEQSGSVTGKLRLQQFGNYDLVRRIDVGGMGEVYLARQRTAFGREVAVKIIRSDLVHDVTARKRFLREAEVNAYLKHEHILPLLEFGEEQGRLFLVTPYIEGGTLARRLQHGTLSLDEIHQLFSALAQAVAYLHRRGVIHRDLKPGNILLDSAEDSDQIYVRLIDFGIASLQGSAASAPLTMAGHEMGTLAYMAPERVNGIAAPSNDIYSLGVILYQMFTRTLSTNGTLDALPAPMRQVVQYATAANPNERLASADLLLKAFEQAYQEMKAAAPEEIVPPRAEPIVPVTPSRMVQETPPIALATSDLPQNREKSGKQAVQGYQAQQTKVVNPTRPTKAASPLSLPPLPLQKSAQTPDPSYSSGLLDSSEPSSSSASAQVLEKVEPAEMVDVPDAVVAPKRSGLFKKRVRAMPKNDSGSLPDKEAGLSPVPFDVEEKQEEVIISAFALKGRTFHEEDYNAITAVLGPASTKAKQLADDAQIQDVLKTKHGRKKPKSLVVAIVSLGIVALLLAIMGLGFLAFQASITATVTITPQVKTVSKVLTITAKPSLQMMDVGTASIPATVLSSTQQNSLQGKTSGINGCTFIIIDCSQSVSFMDVALLAEQVKPAVRTKIQQDLKQQAQAQGATIVGNIGYTNDNVSSDPQIGSPSKVVVVTFSEQGSVEVVKEKDVRDLAQLLLQQQIGTNYTLMSQLTQMGQPVIQSIGASDGTIKIAMAVGGVESYQISDAQTSDIQNHLKGMKLKDAQSYIAKLPNLDPKGMNVHVSYGDTIPNNVQQIKVVTATPTNLPSVQMPATPSGTPLGSG